MTVQFITGRDSGLMDVAIAPSDNIGAIKTGMTIEINHRDYKVGVISVIVGRRNNNYADSHITYQVHVKPV